MNENKKNLLDDPRLTAYALDQLPDDERGEVEQLLEQSAEAREAVTEIRRAGELLRGAMLSEPADAASPSLREAVVANLAAAAPVTELPVTEIVDRFYAEVEAQGGSRLDTSSLITLLPGTEAPD